jgi:hypothetical protein
MPFGCEDMIPIATTFPDFGPVESADILFTGPESVARFVMWCQAWVKRLHWFRCQILDNVALPSPVPGDFRPWLSSYVESADPKVVADHCRQQLHEFGIIDIPQDLALLGSDIDPYTLENCQRVERLLSWATGQCRARFGQAPPPANPAGAAPPADRGDTTDTGAAPARTRRAVGAGADRPLTDTERRILSHCRKKAHKGERIAQHVGLSYDHARRLLGRLVRENRLRNTADGYRTV